MANFTVNFERKPGLAVAPGVKFTPKAVESSSYVRTASGLKATVVLNAKGWKAPYSGFNPGEWTPEEDKAVAANKPLAELSKELGRTVMAVARRRYVLGVGKVAA